MKTLSKNQENQILNIVDETIEMLFVRCHQIAETKSGDITPMQQWELNEAIGNLKEILISQIEQNL